MFYPCNTHVWCADLGTFNIACYMAKPTVILTENFTNNFAIDKFLKHVNLSNYILITMKLCKIYKLVSFSQVHVLKFLGVASLLLFHLVLKHIP